MPITELLKKIDNYKKIFSIENFTEILIDVFFESGTIEDDFIDIIQTRLYDEGTDADNRKLRTASAIGTGFYSPYTMHIKESNGQKISNVTLKDEGDFYDSMDGRVKRNEWKLIADFGDMFENFSNMYSNETKFKNKILDLSEPEKINYIRTEILPDFLLYLKQQINNV